MGNQVRRRLAYGVYRELTRFCTDLTGAREPSSHRHETAEIMSK